MKESALYSLYVTGGIPQELVPAQILDAVCENPSGVAGGEETIIDEIVDPSLRPLDFDSGKLEEYMNLVLSTEKKLPLAFAGTYTRIRVLSALIDALWLKGHFRLGDVSLKASWTWNMAPVGAASAFYESVQAVADFMDSLGLKLNSYSYSEGAESELHLESCLSSDSEDMEDIFVKDAYRSDNPSLGSERACPSNLVPDPQSWVVYVPFESCDYRLGGSLLAQTLSLSGGVSPQISDPDYFMDCHEVLRELVEDGIVISGATVAEGGLIKALRKMCGGNCGLDVNLTDLISSYEEPNIVRLLFAEVPGAVIQIKDMDFDYLDAELLLQDVAYFPLGHPVVGRNDVCIAASQKSGIQTILESLIQYAEGED